MKTTVTHRRSSRSQAIPPRSPSIAARRAGQHRSIPPAAARWAAAAAGIPGHVTSIGTCRGPSPTVHGSICSPVSSRTMRAGAAGTTPARRVCCGSTSGQRAGTGVFEVVSGGRRSRPQRRPSRASERPESAHLRPLGEHKRMPAEATKPVVGRVDDLMTTRAARQSDPCTYWAPARSR